MRYNETGRRVNGLQTQLRIFRGYENRFCRFLRENGIHTMAGARGFVAFKRRLGRGTRQALAFPALRPSLQQI